MTSKLKHWIDLPGETMTEDQIIAEIAEAIELCDHPFSSEELAKSVYARLVEAGIIATQSN